MGVNLGPKNREGEQGPQGDQGLRGLAGKTGKDGSRWFDSNGKPNEEIGVAGDYYLDRKSGDFFKKFSDGWNKQGNIKGPKGEPGKNGLSLTQVVHSTVNKKGQVIIMFDEISLTADATGEILSYTVPIDRAFDVLEILVSGENIGEYIVTKTDNLGTETLAKKRTNWTAFNHKIPLHRFTFRSTDIIKIIATNARPTTANFNATLIGDLYGV